MPFIKMPMPAPGTAEAPNFDGNDVSKFLRTWERICGDRRESPGSYLEYIAEYCDPIIEPCIDQLA
jgi:hypothetical protein